MNRLENLREQVLSLPTVDREQLMEDILASFDPSGRESIDKAWVVEALDRIAAYDRGEMELADSAWADEIESRRKAYREGRIGTVTLDESRSRMGL